MAKAAILIDGGYSLKRHPVVRPDFSPSDPEDVAKSVRQLVRSHLTTLNDLYNRREPFALLYRVFHYDAIPYGRRAHMPISGRAIDDAKTDQATIRMELFSVLHRSRSLSVRLGEVPKDTHRSWILKDAAQKDLLKKQRAVEDLTDDDFEPALRQKCVDTWELGSILLHLRQSTRKVSSCLYLATRISFQ